MGRDLRGQLCRGLKGVEVRVSHTSLAGGKERGGKTVQPQRPPSLEQLEPRLLLSADLAGVELLLGQGTLAREHAIFVDLDREQTDLQYGQRQIVAAVLTETVHPEV